jgi:hypothetical protein
MGVFNSKGQVTDAGHCLFCQSGGGYLPLTDKEAENQSQDWTRRSCGTRYKQNMKDVWRYLDNAFVRLDSFLPNLILPVNTAKVVREQDWKSLEVHLDLLLHTFKHAKEWGMTPIVLDVNNLKQK